MIELNDILNRMAPITLQQMEGVKLMNRIDSKYLTDRATLTQLLERIADQYYVQHNEDIILAKYHTLYFDTKNLAMYIAHHNKILNRQKIRVRTYLTSNTTFFELKRKNNRGRTKKKRIEIPIENFENCLTLEAVDKFLHKRSRYQREELIPTLENSFTRITLVDKSMHERITIDSNITFINRQTHLNYGIEPLVVIEVKREMGAAPSPINIGIRDLRIKPCRMSKYCIGTALTNPKAKQNRWKQKIHYINKIIS